MSRSALLALGVIGLCVGCSSGESGTTQPTGTSGGTASTQANVATASYSDIQAMFDKSCVGCHGQSNPKEGVSLVNHEAVMKGGEHGPIVAAGDPENSALIHVLRASHGKKQMPLNASPWAEEDIKKIEAWIKDGAKP